MSNEGCFGVKNRFNGKAALEEEGLGSYSKVFHIFAVPGGCVRPPNLALEELLGIALHCSMKIIPLGCAFNCCGIPILTLALSFLKIFHLSRY